MANSLKSSLIIGTPWADLMSYHTKVYSNDNFNVSGIDGNWEVWSISPFVYTGNALEIAVELQCTGAGATSSSIPWYGNNTISENIIGGSSSSSLPDILNATSTNALKNRPNIRIIYTIPAQPQTITFPAMLPATYGVADIIPGAITSATGLSVNYKSSNTAVATIVNNKIHITGTGSTTITASQPGNAAYAAAADVAQSLSINKAALTITADNLNMLSGLPVPTLTASYTGFAYGETLSVLTTPPSLSTTATKDSPPGTYPIAVSGATAANYIISYVNGTMIVSAQTQTINFSNITKTYGDADFDPGATATSGLPVNYASDNTKVATIVNNKIHIISAGTANITASQPGDVDFSAAPNVVAALTVNKADQTISISDMTKTYGDADFSPATTVAYLKAAYATSDTGVAKIVNGKLHINGAGTATITASQPGDSNFNAAPNAASAALTVNKALLIIQANDQSVIQGYPFNPFTVSYFGLVYGETENKLKTKPIVNTPIANSLVPVGNYMLDPNGAISNNYNISYRSGILTVTAVTVDGKGQASAFFPNPSLCQIRIYASVDQKAVLQMVDLTGHILLAKDVNLAYGLNTIQLPAANITAGPYIIKIKGTGAGGVNQAIRIVKANN